MVARNAAESATAAEVVVGFLAGRGVRRCYCVPGESFLELIDAIDRHPKLELVSCRHESGAAFMDEADAKLTGVPAVVLATRAVGAANAAIGVHTARQDRTPMLVLLGQVPTAFLGREAFQEVDLPAFYREITVHAETVHRADWDKETGVLTVEPVQEYAAPVVRHQRALPDPGDLVALVRERVMATVVVQQRFPVRGRKGFSVIGRRPPRGGEVVWAFELDEGVDPDDPTVRESTSRALAEARASVGL